MQVLSDHAVVAVGELAGGDTFVVGLHQDRRAVLIGAADHEDLVAGKALVTTEHIRRHAEAGDVTKVARTARIGPSNRRQDVPRHG
jgi:hypothetical protein